MIRFEIHIAGFTRIIGVRGSRRLATMYVTGASWKANGLVPASIRWSGDATKAMTFSRASAEAIVKAYKNRQMTIVPKEVSK